MVKIQSAFYLSLYGYTTWHSVIQNTFNRKCIENIHTENVWNEHEYKD